MLALVAALIALPAGRVDVDLPEGWSVSAVEQGVDVLHAAAGDVRVAFGAESCDAVFAARGATHLGIGDPFPLADAPSGWTARAFGDDRVACKDGVAVTFAGSPALADLLAALDARRTPTGVTRAEDIVTLPGSGSTLALPDGVTVIASEAGTDTLSGGITIATSTAACTGERYRGWQRAGGTDCLHDARGTVTVTSSGGASVDAILDSLRDERELVDTDDAIDLPVSGWSVHPPAGWALLPGGKLDRLRAPDEDVIVTIERRDACPAGDTPFAPAWLARPWQGLVGADLLFCAEAAHGAIVVTYPGTTIHRRPELAALLDSLWKDDQDREPLEPAPPPTRRVLPSPFTIEVAGEVGATQKVTGGGAQLALEWGRRAENASAEARAELGWDSQSSLHGDFGFRLGLPFFFHLRAIISGGADGWKDPQAPSWQLYGGAGAGIATETHGRFLALDSEYVARSEFGAAYDRHPGHEWRGRAELLGGGHLAGGAIDLRVAGEVVQVLVGIAIRP